ncbi:DNA adenine methylase [Algoriphagus yeomjeoni]|uniref:site-specific DNA-methyltransferase (adenine-specific) n=1 Tax=Algoriphagus yeomjeoni TaxID=291403 RepID=A0A327P724_9BACT|nr:DNA adenine methylase [Algoriphagus yeomjeoni]RAI88065.1 adenine-specific DNA-methyltransferase [Algoriphagus yeomjeoni]
MREINLPVTRYYGSKRKLVGRIWSEIENLDLAFDSVLDLFGGTAIFSYYAKVMGKKVIYNDIFSFNTAIGRKLIQQTSNDLSYEEALALLQPNPDYLYKKIIQENFRNIYFTDAENEQIDIFIQNANELKDENKRLSAYYILFQSCIIKRPYNLFHRNNLNMRLNYNGGNFGNKKTWERSFEELFERFLKELDEFTFDNGRDNLAVNFNALDCQETADLIYIDPPYFSSSRNHTTYHAKYHFLEGLANYDKIIDHINHAKNNKEITINKSDHFEKSATFLADLERIVRRYNDSIIVISYRNNGIPSVQSINDLLVLCRPDRRVHTLDLGLYGYALNKGNQFNSEFLIIGTNNII